MQHLLIHSPICTSGKNPPANEGNIEIQAWTWSIDFQSGRALQPTAVFLLENPNMDRGACEQQLHGLYPLCFSVHGFFQQASWSELPFPHPGIPPQPRDQPEPSALAGRLTTGATETLCLSKSSQSQRDLQLSLVDYKTSRKRTRVPMLPMVGRLHLACLKRKVTVYIFACFTSGKGSLGNPINLQGRIKE